MARDSRRLGLAKRWWIFCWNGTGATHGVVVTLRALSETGESIEPIALAPAHTSGEALEDLSHTWNSLRDIVGSGSTARKNL
ncbi:MAG: hypothetical protein AB7V46_04875 [Thermomicrobiales bacterium]